MSLRLLLCDLDGTLTPTAQIDEACFTMALAQEFGHRMEATDWSSYPEQSDCGLSRRILNDALGREPGADEIHRLQYRFLSLLEQARCSNPELFQANAGVFRLLDLLRNRSDWKVGIVSAGWCSASRLKLRWAGLEELGLPLFCPREGTPTSALPESKRSILERARASLIAGEPKQSTAIYVGDNLWDARIALQCGLHFLGHGQGEHRERLQAAGAVAVLKDFVDSAEILRLLDELCSSSSRTATLD